MGVAGDSPFSATFQKAYPPIEARRANPLCFARSVAPHQNHKVLEEPGH